MSLFEALRVSRSPQMYSPKERQEALEVLQITQDTSTSHTNRRQARDGVARILWYGRLP